MNGWVRDLEHMSVGYDVGELARIVPPYAEGPDTTKLLYYFWAIAIGYHAVSIKKKHADNKKVLLLLLLFAFLAFLFLFLLVCVEVIYLYAFPAIVIEPHCATQIPSINLSTGFLS